MGSDRQKTKKIKLELEFELELERLLRRRLAIPATAGLLVYIYMIPEHPHISLLTRGRIPEEMTINSLIFRFTMIWVNIFLLHVL